MLKCISFFFRLFLKYCQKWVVVIDKGCQFFIFYVNNIIITMYITYKLLLDADQKYYSHFPLNI